MIHKVTLQEVKDGPLALLKVLPWEACQKLELVIYALKRKYPNPETKEQIEEMEIEMNDFIFNRLLHFYTLDKTFVYVAD